jgi:DNA-binding Lrp family transcriptional regulator
VPVVLGEKDTSPREGVQQAHHELASLANCCGHGRIFAVRSAHMTTDLDALDVDLLATMRAHPRIGVLELSRVLRVARGTVQARLDRLERAGVISGYGPEIDVVAAGYGVQAFVTLDINQGALDEVTAELAASPAVLEAYATTGSSDVLCRLAASSHEELQQALLALDRSSFVSRSTSIVVLSVVVPTRALPLLRSSPRQGPRRAPAYRGSPEA